MRHLAFQPLPLLSSRHDKDGAQPKPASIMIILSFGVPLEHAFQHDAREHRLLALRMANHLLDVSSASGGGDRDCHKAEGMHADRKPDLFGGLVNPGQ